MSHSPAPFGRLDLWRTFLARDVGFGAEHGRLAQGALETMENYGLHALHAAQSLSKASSEYYSCAADGYTYQRGDPFPLSLCPSSCALQVLLEAVGQLVQL